MSGQITELQRIGNIISTDISNIVTGKVVPNSFGMNNSSTQNTLTKILDVLQYNQDNLVTRDELATILKSVFQQYMNISFYMGDEQVAKHANAGNAKLNYRFNPVAR